MKSIKRDIHVVPNHSNGQLDWSVKRECGQRPSGTYHDKTSAMDAARRIAINNRLEVVEHNKQGVITGSNSYGNDPIATKG